MCIFCKIISGEIPSKKVYEDDNFLAFLDLSQTTKGHTLVIPKKHYSNIYELENEGLDIMHAVKKVALILRDTFSPIGINIVSNNLEPYQSVPHFHIHLLPRYKNDGFTISFNEGEPKANIDEVYEQIKGRK